MNARLGRAIRKAIAMLRGRSMIRPEALVKAARNPGHPLHSFIEWDDAVAAEKYRTERVGRWLQGATVTIDNQEKL